MSRPSLDDYVDVAERIQQFKEEFPDGTLQRASDPTVLSIGGRDYIVYTAVAYRTPDDPRPGVGTAWEPVPGSTPYTKDSELMNAETAAWGRAIVALGFATKKIASRQEVRNRQEGKPKEVKKDESFELPVTVERATLLAEKLCAKPAKDVSLAFVAHAGEKLGLNGLSKDEQAVKIFEACCKLGETATGALEKWAS